METIGKTRSEIKKAKIAEAEKGLFLAGCSCDGHDRHCGCGFRRRSRAGENGDQAAVLGEADGILRAEVIIASNTSSISMTALAR